MKWFTPEDVFVFIVCLLVGLGDGIALPTIPWVPIVSEPPPFKTDKLAVLVVEETVERGSYTPGQREAMLAVDGAGSIRGYIKAKNGEYLLWDKDQAPSKDTPAWVAEALKVRGDKLPWIVAASPSTGFTKQVPATAEETIAALRKVGGP